MHSRNAVRFATPSTGIEPSSAEQTRWTKRQQHIAPLELLEKPPHRDDAMRWEADGVSAREYRAAGDSSLDSAANVALRAAIFDDGEVRLLIDRFFDTFPSARAAGAISRFDMTQLCVKICRVLFEPADFDLDEATAIANADWDRSYPPGTLSIGRDAFARSMFELVGVWTGARGGRVPPSCARSTTDSGRDTRDPRLHGQLRAVLRAHLLAAAALTAGRVRGSGTRPRPPPPPPPRRRGRRRASPDAAARARAAEPRARDSPPTTASGQGPPRRDWRAAAEAVAAATRPRKNAVDEAAARAGRAQARPQRPAHTRAASVARRRRAARPTLPPLPIAARAWRRASRVLATRPSPRPSATTISRRLARCARSRRDRARGRLVPRPLRRFRRPRGGRQRRQGLDHAPARAATVSAPGSTERAAGRADALAVGRGFSCYIRGGDGGRASPPRTPARAATEGEKSPPLASSDARASDLTAKDVPTPGVPAMEATVPDVATPRRPAPALCFLVRPMQKRSTTITRTLPRQRQGRALARVPRALARPS